MKRLLYGLVFTGLVILYFHGLGSHRIYLSVEEVLQALQAHAIASTGRDLVGRWIPVYPAEPWYEAGRDPLWVYATAVLLRLVSFSEAVVRGTSAAAGVVNVLLMYVLAREIFGRERVAVGAAVLLAMTPAHFFQSRLATSQIAPITFVLLWLVLLARYRRSSHPRDLFAATAVLGIGIYSYLSAIFLMPFFLLLTLVMTPQHKRTALAGFGLTIIPFVAWHLAHPERVGHLLGYYTANGYNADLAAPMSIGDRLLMRVDALWTALNPAALFFSGDGNLRFSTQHSGHFLLPVFALSALGLASLNRSPLRQWRWIVLTGLVVTPLPAVLSMSGEIKRWLAFIPFVILVAAAGLYALTESGRRVARGAALLMVLLSAAQFTSFVRDYWTDYRERSFFFYGGDLGTAARLVLDSTDEVSCVMVERRVPILDHWLLYTRVRRLDGAAAPVMVDGEDAAISLPPHCREGGLLIHSHVASQSGGVEGSLLGRGWKKIPIPEPGGKTLLTLFWYHSP